MKKRINSLTTRNVRNKEFINYDQIKDIFILFNIENWSEIEKIISDLQNEGKRVQAWTVRQKNKTVDKIFYSNLKVIDASKDCSWTKDLSKNLLDEFNSLQYDTFLDLTTSTDYILDYLLATNTSKFCIGLHENEPRVHDFVLLHKENSSIYESFEQLKGYLKNMVQV